MIDSDYVPRTVKALLTAELSPSTAAFRMLDDPEVDSQPRSGYPLVEIEFTGGNLEKQEYGDPGYNIWAEGAGGGPTSFMVHVHVDRSRGTMAEARAVMDAVCSIFCGRTYLGIEFFSALAAYDDDGSGLTRGVSRAIEYRYEFSHR